MDFEMITGLLAEIKKIYRPTFKKRCVSLADLRDGARNGSLRKLVWSVYIRTYLQWYVYVICVLSHRIIII